MRLLPNLTIPSWDTIGKISAVGLVFVVPTSTALTNFFMIVICVMWLLGPNRALKMQIAWNHPLVKAIYPLVALSFLGIIYSIGDYNEIRHSVTDIIRLLFIPILIYFYRDEKIARWAKWAFILAMLITLILVFLKVYAGLPIGLKYTAGAIFKNHIKTSFFMAIAAFFLASYALQSKRYRLLAAGLVLLMGYYLFFISVGRIGYITFILSGVWLAGYSFGKKGLLCGAGMALCLLMGAYTTSEIFSQRINLLAQDLDFYHQGGRLIESSLGSRLAFGQSSLDIILERPWLGWGTGSFKEVYARHHQGEVTLLTDNPHNEFLRVGVELGFVGFVLLIFLFYRQWQLSSQLPIKEKGLYRGILLTFILGCLFNSWIKDFTEAYFYCVMTAIYFASLPLPERRHVAKAILH